MYIYIYIYIYQNKNMKKVGHNSGPTQKQKCVCESTKEQIQTESKAIINHNLKNTTKILSKT